MLSLTYERHFSRVALLDRILDIVGDRFPDIVGALDTRDGEPVAIHSIPRAVAGKDTFLLEAECSTPVVAGSTRSRLAAGLGNFERAAGNSILLVEVDNSMFPPGVGIRMFSEVGDSQLFDPSVADSTVVNTDSTLTS